MGEIVGVVGLGNMGRGIAKNIAKGQHTLLVWDVNEEARVAFEGTARIAEPAVMAATADFIIFVVPGSQQIEGMLGEIIPVAKTGLVLWDFTTSDPTYTKRLAKQAGDSGIHYMDAGMTCGGAKGADEGTMTLMFGGDEDIFIRSQSVLKSCARELIYLGPSGAGHTMKVVVGDSYDNALAETINGLYKTELVYNLGPWRSIEQLELATLKWVHWFNHERLMGPIGDVPPAELEQLYEKLYPTHAEAA